MSVLLLRLLFWALVIIAVIALVRSLGGTRQGSPPAADRERPSAEQLLDGRFARGEIDEDEYTRRGQLLQANR